MTPWQAAILALVQAVTEFLPISSSGHLILMPRLLGWADQGLEFDIATNTGTLLAVMLYFRDDLLKMARALPASLTSAGRAERPEARLLFALALGTIPAAVVGLLAKDWIATYGRDPRLIAATAIFYGGWLIYADRAGTKIRGEDGFGVREALLIGGAQALALVPGTSRSGITMTAALLLGFARPAAARFSFLLSVPIGLLVAANQLKDLVLGEPLGVAPLPLGIGIAVAAAAGFAVIALFLAWIRRRPLAPFGWYRIALGIALLLLFRA
ncbi:MAG: undecaprenyl-diphosphate phosphatase [Thermoanaerobaculia bacterium]